MKTYGYVNYESPLFPKPKNGIELEEAMEKLIQTKYHSFFAEKRRWYVLKDKVSVIYRPDELKEKFVILIKSYLYSIKAKGSVSEIINNCYFTNSNKQTYKVLYNDETMSFSCNYVVDDVLYTDTFDINTKKNGSSYLTIKRSILAPFTLEIWSFRATMAKWNFRKAFKNYSQKIKEGI